MGFKFNVGGDAVGVDEFDLRVEILDSTKDIALVKFTLSDPSKSPPTVVSSCEILELNGDTQREIQFAVSKLYKRIIPSNVESEEGGYSYDYEKDPTDCRIIPFPLDRTYKN